MRSQLRLPWSRDGVLAAEVLELAGNGATLFGCGSSSSCSRSSVQILPFGQLKKFRAICMAKLS